MLKTLVRERLIAAADEIFGLFETTITSYEEQLYQAREESERHRRQLEAVCKTQVVVRVEDIQLLIGQQEIVPSSTKQKDVQVHHVKGEAEDPQPSYIKEEKERADVGQLPLTAVFVASDKDEPREWSQRHHGSPSGDHCGGPPPDHLLAPLSHREDMKEPIGSDAHSGDCLQQLIGCQAELPAQPQWGSSSVEQEDPHVKEENVEAAVSKLPRTGATAHNKHEPPERSRLHRSPSGDQCGGPASDALMAPLSDSDDVKERLRRDAGCEGDDKLLKCSEKQTRKATSQMHEKRATASVSGKRLAMSRVGKHTSGKTFSCSVCSKAFSLKRNMITHMTKHTSGNPFRCSTCGKSFSTKHSLVPHMRTHTGEKPFGCSVCGKRFAVQANRVRHMRIHTGEKPFSCPLCHKTFPWKYYMVSHMRTHTREKPYRCSDCGVSYAHKATLTIHEWKHNKGRINDSQK